MKMKTNNMFRDQVNSVTTWFGSWSTCEQTVVLYSLLKMIPPRHCRFLVQMLQQRVKDDKEVETQEEEANDPAYIHGLQQETKEKAIQELLVHLPLLHSGNTEAKNEYLSLIPAILAHSIKHGTFIEESRQLLSYSLIHPAITSEERSKFNLWLGHLDEHFSCNYHSPSSQGQPDDTGSQAPSHPSHPPPQTSSHHAPLRRMPSVAPPKSLLVTNTNSVHDWLQSNDVHLIQGSGRPLSGLSDHAPLSPQSSTASSGSASDGPGEEGPHPVRNTFMEEASGMRGGSIKLCVQEMKAILNSPVKAFHKPEPESPLNSPGAGGDADNTIEEGNIPGQLTRLMTKVYSQLMLTSPYDDEGLNMYLQLIDKCINHEAFSQKQKRLLDTFKQQARKIWQPAPVKYGYDKKPRPNTRPISRQGVKPPVTQQHSLGTQWSFGARRSVIGGGMVNPAHLQLQRNNSHNTAVFSRPGVMEPQGPMKQPITRTQSAPLRSQGFPYTGMSINDTPTATDTEINARLDSLCRSVTECALSGSASSHFIMFKKS
ncbi:SMAG1-like protein [Mya arenaria]|uniref:SMAG1-like protein n=1 Tax=Mya arenaria TaxID=6604 RepID=A0ABY7FEB3_MYAAR|nr:SMAG1-like protein [Mya arenaria]